MSRTDPLPPDIVDELISARIDGEFERAARELELDPLDASARLEATPGVAERTRALEAARDAIAASVDLDELSRRRLVEHALTEAAGAKAPEFPRRAAPARRDRRSWLVAGGAVAAAAAVIVGLVAILHDGGSQNAKSSTAAAGNTQTTIAPPNEIDNADQLRSYVESLIAGNQLNAPAAAPQSPASTAATPPEALGQGRAGTATTTVPAGNPAAANGSTKQLAADCPATLGRQLRATSGPLAVRSVRHQGRRAEVAVYAQGEHTLAVVYDRNDCVPLISYLSR